MDQLRIVVGFKVDAGLRGAARAGLGAGRRRREDGAPENGDGPGAPETRYVRRVFNVFDEAALELALRLRDARAEAGLETSLAAFSVAGREADPFLQTLQALGFDGAARVDPGAGLDFAPRVTAAVIAAYLRRIGPPDVLLLGSRCGPGESGTVPFLVADELGLPCLTEVTEVQAASRGRLRVTFAAGGGPARATVAPPCVLAVGNAVVSMLRVPTLRDRLAARDRPLDLLSPGELGVDVDAALARRAGRARGHRDHRPRARRDDRPGPDARGEGARAVRDPPPRAPGEAVSARETLRVAVVLDGTAATAERQARALGGFLREGLRLDADAQLVAATHLFHADATAEERLLALVPTTDVRLIRTPALRADLMTAALTAFETGGGAELFVFPGGPLGDRAGGAPGGPLREAPSSPTC